jgi:serine/threonine-protein kinase RsbW
MSSDGNRAPGGMLQDRGSNTGERFVVEIPPDARAISLARVFASTVARAFGCREELIDDIKIAISEACTNAVKAHERAGIRDDIVVGVTRPDAGSLQFEIVDHGRASDDSSEAEPDANLGVLLIGSLFAGAEITAVRPQGSTVRFTVSTAAQ